MKPRKVFSHKLAKSYWITLDLHEPINKLPCFTDRECGLIKTLMAVGEFDTKALEWLYAKKLEDWRYDAFPKEQMPVKAELSVLETNPNVVRAREECLTFVRTVLKPSFKEEDTDDALAYPEMNEAQDGKIVF